MSQRIQVTTTFRHFGFWMSSTVKAVELLNSLVEDDDLKKLCTDYDILCQQSAMHIFFGTHVANKSFKRKEKAYTKKAAAVIFR